MPRKLTPEESNLFESIKESYLKNMQQVESDGAASEAHPVLLAKVVLRITGENITFNSEMRRLYNHLKHFI